MTPDMLGAAPANLGRRTRGIPLGGRLSARAYGDAGTADLDINSDVRGAPAAQPGHGLLRFIGGLMAGTSSFGGQRLPREQEPSAWYDPGGPGGAYGGGWADGVLTVRDRHVMTRRGYTRNPQGGGSSMPSPDLDGRPRAEYQMLNVTESWQLGTDATRNMDNTGVHNTVPVTGRPGKLYPLGTQDGTLAIVMGPPIGEWRTYGARGGIGMHGPPPDEYDVNVVGKAKLTAQGAPMMQPGDLRTVYGGVPHGLHSPTASSLVWTGARYASTPQMRPPRLDRPNSSKIAGQSMSQQYPSEAQAGRSSATPRQAAGRMPGLDTRFRGRS